MNRTTPTIGIVLPCYNEEQMLPLTMPKIKLLIDSLIASGIIADDSFAAFVDDGSRDNTWNHIEEYALQQKHVKGLKLAGNAGHQKALFAGLVTFMQNADALISIDADLQDDITVIEDMILKFRSGTDVVYGVRKERDTDTVFKKNTALLFYKIMLKMKVNIVYNHADYRLCSRRVLEALSEFGEMHLFLRGIIPSIGFKSDTVAYDRLKREAGESKYPIRKMASFAWDGITSFSSYPLKMVTALGFIIFLVCVLFSAYALVSLYMENTVPGWVSIVLPMYFLGGVQLFCIGIIGEYIGKIYIEVKKRPRYFDKKID